MQRGRGRPKNKWIGRVKNNTEIVGGNCKQIRGKGAMQKPMEVQNKGDRPQIFGAKRGRKYKEEFEVILKIKYI